MVEDVAIILNPELGNGAPSLREGASIRRSLLGKWQGKRLHGSCSRGFGFIPAYGNSFFKSLFRKSSGFNVDLTRYCFLSALIKLSPVVTDDVLPIKVGTRYEKSFNGNGNFPFRLR